MGMSLVLQVLGHSLNKSACQNDIAIQLAWLKISQTAVLPSYDSSPEWLIDLHYWFSPGEQDSDAEVERASFLAMAWIKPIPGPGTRGGSKCSDVNHRIPLLPPNARVQMLIRWSWSGHDVSYCDLNAWDKSTASLRPSGSTGSLQLLTVGEDRTDH